jgi:hypothetical protein
MTPVRLALLLAVLAAVAAWQVTVIPQSAIEMTVGAQEVPALVVALLAATVALYALSAWRGQQRDEAAAPEQGALPGAGRRMGFLLAGGLAFMVTVAPVGFVAAGTLCGVGVARAFDAPLDLKTLMICAALAGAFWLLFGQLLGVGLGPALRWPL